MNKNFSDKDINGKIKNAIKNKDASTLLSSLSENDKKLFDSLLRDEKARNEILSSPEAHAIITALFGGR